MHDFVYFDGDLLHAKEARLAAVSPASLYGKGVFTTLSIHDGRPFLWGDHWRRLSENADALSINLARHSQGSVLSGLSDLLEKNLVSSGRARITFFDCGPGVLWGNTPAEHTAVLITTGDRQNDIGNFKVGISPFPVFSRSPFSRVKSCNYLDKLAALGESTGRSLNESLRLNEHGAIVSACMANVFWTINRKLYTPSLNTGCLPGTTRAHILRNFDCEEVEEGPAVLERANALFLTSAGLGVRTVDEFLGRKMDPVTAEISRSVP